MSPFLSFSRKANGLCFYACHGPWPLPRQARDGPVSYVVRHMFRFNAQGLRTTYECSSGLSSVTTTHVGRQRQMTHLAGKSPQKIQQSLGAQVSSLTQEYELTDHSEALGVLCLPGSSLIFIYLRMRWKEGGGGLWALFRSLRS